MSCFVRLKFLLLAAALLAAVESSQQQSLASPAPAAHIDGAAVKRIVKDSDILPPEFKQQVYSTFENGTAAISLFRHPQSTKADCKIDSILLARKIIQLDPRVVNLVRFYFYDYDHQNEFWEVDVRAQLVRAFAEGKIGQSDLINSVLLREDRQANALSEKYAGQSYKSILDENSVVPGAHAEKRLATSLRLKELERQGVDTGSFKDQFLRLEDAARRGHERELHEHIQSLNKQIDSHVQDLVGAGQLKEHETSRRKTTLLEANSHSAKNASGTHSEKAMEH